MCEDGTGSDDPRCDDGYWTDERRHQAKPMPLPGAETPSDDTLRHLEKQREGSSGAGAPPAVDKVICGEGDADAATAEACAEEGKGYWTEERRRKARPLLPSVPKPEGLEEETEGLDRSTPGEGGARPLTSLWTNGD